MRQDLLYALRTFRKNPGFTAVVVASIALGIAANTTVFSIVNGLLFGSLPVREPSRLVSFNGGSTNSWRNYVDFRDGTKEVFEGLSAHFPVVPASIGGLREPERVWGQLVTANYFSVIGAEIPLGRGFQSYEDEAAGRNPVVVLSHALWTRRFGADPAVVGRDIILNGFPYRVVGVTGRGYKGSDGGLVSEFWAPLAMMAQIAPDMSSERLNISPTSSRNSHWLVVNGRLRPGVTLDQARAAVNVIQGRIDEELKLEQSKRRGMRLTAAGVLVDNLGSQLLPLLIVMMVVVGLVLLIACANVANVLLARATARQKEIGIRLAVGAGRGRLLRQLLTESLLLSGMGAAVGFVLAWWAATSVARFELPLPIPIAFNFTPDLRVLAFTAGIAILSGILFGFAPAIRATRPDLVTALKNDTVALGATRRFGLRNGLVVAQVSLSLVLLVGATLFLRSLGNAASIDTGMRPDGVVLLAFDPKLNGYSTDRTKLMLSQLRDRVEALPGVTSVSFLDTVPLSIGGTGFDFRSGDNKQVNANVYYAGTRFFETMGIGMLRGREFDANADRGGNVAIVNEHMARQLFGDSDPLGREITADKSLYRIVGVSRNSKSRTLAEDPVNCAYLFLESNPEKVLSIYGISIAAKTAGHAPATMKAIRDQILALDPNLAVFNSETMREHVDKALMLPRVCATLLGVFGGTGLMLAVIGLYGVMSYAVRSRTREIGIRMALGAEQHGVLGMVTRQGMMLAGTGLVVGLALSYAAARFLASFLYGLSATDPFTFGVVPLVLLAVAAIAILVPARRASKVDPLVALRYE